MNTVIFDSIQDFKSAEGTSLPNGEWFTITQQMIDDFAEATLDKQWIHIDKDKAAKYSPFKKTVAHGFMVVAMISKKIQDVVHINNVKIGLNYGVDKVRFPAPAIVDSELRLISSVKQIEDYADNGIKVTFECKMELKGQEKPACVAEFITLMFE